MTNLLSRKFILTVLSVTLSFVLVVTNKIGGAEWLAFIGTILGLYVVVNQAQANREKEEKSQPLS